MPDTPPPKPHAHPFVPAAKPHASSPPWPSHAHPAPPFVELVALSNHTFLTGASHPEELVHEAKKLGYQAIGIADVNTLAGVVRAHVAGKDAGIRCLIGSRLQLADTPGSSVIVYPHDRAAYGHLCRLLTLGKRRSEKGSCTLTLDDLDAYSLGLEAILLPPTNLDACFHERVRRLQDIFTDDRLSLAASCPYGPDDRAHLESLAALAERTAVPLLATNSVLYHAPHRRPLQDVLTCIRLGISIDNAGYALEPNAERHLKPPDEMDRLFAAFPQSLSRGLEIVRRAAGFSLDQLRYEYPDEVCPPGLSPMEHLRNLTWKGAAERYPAGVPGKITRILEHELVLIDELRYAPYFLTVHDLVVFARSRGILCQGRGAAANSAVCYCLGVTSVDPDRIDLLFERFVSKERNEPPDIDIDFEHERREEVIQYIYAKYGRDRAALTAEVISYRGRSAVREVGKAMGLSLDCVDKLAKTLGWWDGVTIPADRLLELGLDPLDRTIRQTLKLAKTIQGFPRHLSQHVGGFVITRGPLCESVPIENAAMPDRTVIEWDKDDLDAMGMLKVDCLGLGMLSCIRKCLEMINRARAAGAEAPGAGLPEKPPRRLDTPPPFLELHTVPPEDPSVYDMICRADTVGVFQIESRAQMSMLPRLRPRCFYDLVIEVAIVRPGPIQGNMVHPYLRRRNGEEKFTYPNEDVRCVLGRTLGVPLFQEQAMALAMVAGGFSAGEADQLRRAMAAWKRKGDLIFRFGARLIEGMLRNGYSQDFAERCFEQIKGFSEYGFPESHAASFALLVYVSSWLKHHHPAAFAASLINSQPMGFYAPAQIVRDAKEHGVTTRPIDVNHSDWDCTLEDNGLTMRLGMRLTKGLSEEHARALELARHTGPFTSIEDVRRRSAIPTAALRRLARADAFQSIALDRQRALWMIQALDDAPMPLHDQMARYSPDTEQPEEPALRLLPQIPTRQIVRHDYESTGLSLKAHPISFLRDRLAAAKIIQAAQLANPEHFPHGKPVGVAGIVLVRQRPGTASGIVFITLEDETGIANLIVRPNVYEKHRAVAGGSSMLAAFGRVERAGAVVHVHVKSFKPLDHLDGSIAATSRDFH